jgi:hypothetical protein
MRGRLGIHTDLLSVYARIQDDTILSISQPNLLSQSKTHPQKPQNPIYQEIFS